MFSSRHTVVKIPPERRSSFNNYQKEVESRTAGEEAGKEEELLREILFDSLGARASWICLILLRTSCRLLQT